jgi:hypothetical protein
VIGRNHQDLHPQGMPQRIDDGWACFDGRIGVIPA